MNGDPEVEYLRHPLSTKIYGDILVVICLIGGIEKRFFTMDRTMKAITVRRVAKRRWWIERVFWDQKQLLGLPTIHQQTKRRVLTRVHLTFLLSQASIDAAKELGITTNRLHKILRRTPQLLIELIRTDSASVRSPEPANAEEGRLAA